MTWDRIVIAASVAAILAVINLVGWLIYDRGYTDGAAIERRRCHENHMRDTGARHEARMERLEMCKAETASP